ncbi:MAG: MFS transporter [Telmatospirillum sp.]|nr:MFS transporter [Telmatospirillum sp.]
MSVVAEMVDQNQRRYLAASSILIGVLMASLDSSIVNVALPSIAKALDVPPASVIWVTNGYQVASAAMMLICAALGARLGERRIYGIGMILFTVSSLGCALSPTFEMLVAMRVIQGASYAAMVSVGLGLYRVIFPPEALGTIFGLNALTFAVGTAAGPIVGGILVSYLSWPWLFYINIPFGLIATIITYRYLEPDTETQSGFDLVGALTSATAMGLLVVGVDQIGRWNSTVIGAALAGSVALSIVFIFGQYRTRVPLLPLDIFQSRRYSFAVISSVSMFVSQGMALVALPFVLQHLYSYSVIDSAALFTPWPVAVAICAPIAGRLSNRINPTYISTMGLFLYSGGLASLALIDGHHDPMNIIWRVILCGIGYGFFLPPNNKEMFSNVERKRTVTASGVLSTARTAGQSVGVALVAMMLSILGGLTENSGSHFVLFVFSLAFLISIAACIASLIRIHK